MILKGTVVWAPEPVRLEVSEASYLVADGAAVRGVYRELPAELVGEPVEDWGDALIVPAFVDAHVHAPQYLNAGIGMDEELLPWLERRTFPLEARFADAAFASRAYRAFLRELWRQGTLRFVAFGTVHAPATWELMRLADAAGFTALVGKVNMDRNAPASLAEDPARSLGETEELASRAREELAHVGFIATPRFVPSTTDRLMDGLGALVEKYGLPVQSHVDENRSEIELVASLHPKSESYAHVYEEHGLMPRARTILAHGVWLKPSEIDLLRRREVLVAHCPQSNANLTSGVMPLTRTLDSGVACAVASDVAGGSNPGLPAHMACAVRASKLRRVRDDRERALGLAEALYLATKAPGSFAGFADPSGSFEPGYRADVLVIESARTRELDELLGRTPAERLERFIYRGESADIAARSERSQLCRAQLLCRGASGKEVDVVVQVGQLPFKSRRVGQHAQRVLVEACLSVDDFKHNLSARRVGETPVYGRCARVYGHHVYAFHSLLHFVYRLTTAQNPAHQLQVGYGACLLCGVVGFVLAVAREVEQPGRQSFLVDAFGHELFLFHGQPHVAKPCFECHAVGSPSGRVGLLHVASGHDDIPAVQVASAPFDGTCQNGQAARGSQGDARAGCCLRHM